MPRALVLVLDSVGCGQAPDAARYGDAGADTLGHILSARPDLKVPNLMNLGLSAIVGRDGEVGATEVGATEVGATAAILSPTAAGKDTTSGHWELMGAALDEPFATFDPIPSDLREQLEKAAGATFIGGYAASGTTVLDELGATHLQTGKPILYTSADSVLQIAAHEEMFGLERLYEICRAVRAIADDWRIGRVIARPFVGKAGDWQRTSNRRDYSLVPPRTILNALQDAQIATLGIGKISDIFAGNGIGETLPTKSNAAGMETIAREWNAGRQGLLFANLVDFDMLYGHRRDVNGYADALEQFDAWLGEFLPQINDDDLLIITADHGNDPTMPGTDHTRENVPVLMMSGGQKQWLGRREGFAAVAATLAVYFGVDWQSGRSLI